MQPDQIQRHVVACGALLFAHSCWTALSDATTNIIQLHASASGQRACGPLNTHVPIGSEVGYRKPELRMANSSVYKQRSRAHMLWIRNRKAFGACVESNRFVWPAKFADADATVQVGFVVALHLGHDTSIAVSKNGRVQCVLELERLFRVRYFNVGEKFQPCQPFLVHALETVRDRCDWEDGIAPTHFQIGVLTGSDTYCVPELVETVFSVDQWRTVTHHEAHALHAFHASPFTSALVITYDAGSDDGTFNAFVGIGSSLYHILRMRLNFGQTYDHLATLMQEVSSVPVQAWCEGMVGYESLKGSVPDALKGTWVKFSVARSSDLALGDAGKLMGYAATGNITPDIDASVHKFVKERLNPLQRPQFVNEGKVPVELIFAACGSIENQRAIAASVQSAFEEVVLGRIKTILESVTKYTRVEGIAIAGGCALNVIVNQLVRDTFTRATSNSELPREGLTVDDVYVPPGPNDSGIAVGALWAVKPPDRKQPLQYVGFRLWDEDILENEAKYRDAKRLSEFGGCDYLADLLAGNGTAKRPIIAVVRGRQEFGPRALGHRSLLVVPDSADAKNRLNRLKQRKWYRPVAPMIADEALEQVFGHAQQSRTMEMAPRVREDIRKKYPALAHLDGTARHQSVGRMDEPWLHALLLAVGERIGLAALINTSFNSKGLPIINTVKDSLRMLDTLEGLDYVLIEDWLFQSPADKAVENQFDIHSLPDLRN